LSEKSKKRNKTIKTPGALAKKTSGAPGSPMDVSLLDQIVRLMADNDLNTVDVRDGTRRIILKRGAVVAAAPTVMAAAPVAAAAPAAAPAAAAPAVDEDAGLTAIRSPMVGTFYSAPGPNDKAFVQVGSDVTEDTDVCIIEAMKVFNNIKAECRGKIAKVMVQNGQPVEFNTVLFLVKPA
jgi:acetyl-CoA carboxylase biotin carboxyl carrier protein